MVKRLLLFTAALLFFLKPPVTLAVVDIPFIEVPMLECGMAGAPDGLDRCCSGISGNWLLPVNNYLFSIPGLDRLPFFSDIKKTTDAIDDLQKKYGKSDACVEGVQSTSDPANPGCVCKLIPLSAPADSYSKFCAKYINTGSVRSIQALRSCVTCMQKGGGGRFFWTGLGCLPISLGGFLNNFVFTYGIGFAGMAAFLCILYNAIRIQVSEGNSEKLKKAQDNIKSCILGLLLILFAVLLVRIIGVDVLRIPFLR